jgi:hypothetical protein
MKVLLASTPIGQITPGNFRAFDRRESELRVRASACRLGFRFLEGSTRKDGRARSAPRSDQDSPAGAYTPITGMRCTGTLIYTRSSHMAFPLCVLASSFAAPKNLTVDEGIERSIPEVAQP